ncbi:SlyX family protein [Lacipirellula sp.]|uniref:SlyX family protein n=1 Tax=Lacipirellula sp. TaxID=2691419 RepID=UPI003D1503D6
MTLPDIPDPQRLTGLEERLTYQQHLIDQLNEVVLSQGRQLEQLRREVERYTTAVQRMSQNSQGEDLPHEKPPHY